MISLRFKILVSNEHKLYTQYTIPNHLQRHRPIQDHFLSGIWSTREKAADITPLRVFNYCTGNLVFLQRWTVYLQRLGKRLQLRHW